ncbi:MAG: hypothetical protein EPGJADBJ_04627 [Saprospiraceae bacterium]|nr:hypothetical protein [Saprospiraceae bacterium]
MKNTIILLFTFLTAAFSAYPSLANGWPRPKGTGFYKLDFSFIRARSYYGPDGNIYDINGSGTLLGNYTTAFYGEYGITNKLTAIAYIPFLVRNTVNEGVGAITGEVLQPGLENTAFGDADLGFRYGLLKKGAWVLSGSFWLGIPSGDYKNKDLLYTGDGEWNQQLRLEWGYGAARWYATGYTGVNNRTKGFSEEFRYHAEAGYWLVKNTLLASVKLAGVESFRNGDPSGTSNGLFANNVEYVSPQFGLAYERNGKWGLSALVAGAFAGSNALASPSVSVGVYRKME